MLGLLHRLTAQVCFPVMEPLTLGLVLLPRRRWAMILPVMLMALWLPRYFNPVASYEVPEDVEGLCIQLIGELNEAPLAFDEPFDTAGEAAGLPWARVKPVRYPEWMRALGLAGLFCPWTGEAVVDPGAPPGYLPFTCVHELMHLRGIADEGQANIEAYQACMEYGGMYADSARLWALRYGLGHMDEDARARVLRHVSDRLSPFIRIAEPSRLRVPRKLGDYDALLGWLAADFG